MDPLEKTLPHNLEAESAVLGTIMLDPKLFYPVRAIIGSEQFYYSANRKIFDVISRLVSAGNSIDPLIIKNELLKTDELESVGGAPYIASLSDGCSRCANVEAYSEIILEKWRLRSAIKSANQLMLECYQSELRACDLVACHQSQLRTISFGSNGSLVSGCDAVSDAFKWLSQRNDDKRIVTGIPSGIYDLDKITTGFQPGDLTIVAAKTGFGKTAFMLNCVAHALLRHRAKVAIFSLEMKRQQLITRIISAETGIDSYHLMTGHVPPGSWAKIKEIANELAMKRFWLCDKSLSMSELDSQARRLHEEHRIDLITVDYLQLVRVTGKKVENRTQEVTEISRGLKALATDLCIPVIALSQLNSEGEVRESRSIEQDASLVIIIEMTRDDLKKEALVPAEINIQKNRNGSLETIKCNFRKAITRFELPSQ